MCVSGYLFVCFTHIYMPDIFIYVLYSNYILIYVGYVYTLSISIILYIYMYSCIYFHIHIHVYGIS